VGWQDLLQSFMPQGQVAFENDSFVLISLKPSRASRSMKTLTGRQ
jgi:hypothetical protein